MKKVINKILGLLIAINYAGCSLFEPSQTQKAKISPAPIAQESEYSTYDLQEVKASAPEAQASQSIAPQANSRRAEGSMQLYKKEKSQFLGGGAKMMAADSLAERVALAPPTYYSNTESYDSIVENAFNKSLTKPLSTFSIDVDTASYSNMRRFIQQGSMPPKDSVRIEEMINYFDYDYSQPEKGPFSVNMEMAPALWNKKHKLVRIGIKGKEINIDQRPASNLVFLIDVSGSMDSPERLPLVKSSLAMLVDKLNENDKISIVVYAGAAGLVLPPTTGNQKMKILRALDQLKAGGSTNGSGGIELAYKTAQEQFVKGGVNRIILATDGDFNVGVTNRDDLTKLIEKNAHKNIYLTILGFGMGNYKDSTMETLSTKGHGNYAYIDNQSEARKVLVEQLSGTLVTIAKDVKIQVEFNPEFVDSYRLVGYENRALKNEDFNNDKKDAGDIGAGHSVTALYEIIPVGVENSESDEKNVDALKYQKVEKTEKIVKKATTESHSTEWLTVKLRYKKPDGDTSSKVEFTLEPQTKAFEQSSDSFRFASAVALFGMILRKSEHVQDGNLKQVIQIAQKSKGQDKNSYKAEFIELVKKSQNLQSHPVEPDANLYE